MRDFDRSFDNDWINRPTSKKNKTIILCIILSVFILGNIAFPSFRKFNMHVVNFGTYYTEFGVHVLKDKINGEQTDFEFQPINIGHINFGLDEHISKIKSKTVDKYNAESVGDSISEQISGYSMKEALDKVNGGY